MKKWLAIIVTKHNGLQESNLEADDLLGLYSRKLDLNCVIATIDKDLKMIYDVPIYNWDSGETVQLNQGEALRFHMWQTLVGDPTDNYKGCPRIGPVKADKILDTTFAESCQSCDPNYPTVDYLKEAYWSAIMETYESKGLTEEDALVQARCAYILREPDDFVQGSVRLWRPYI